MGRVLFMNVDDLKEELGRELEAIERKIVRAMVLKTYEGDKATTIVVATARMYGDIAELTEYCGNYPVGSDDDAAYQRQRRVTDDCVASVMESLREFCRRNELSFRPGRITE